MAMRDFIPEAAGGATGTLNLKYNLINMKKTSATIAIAIFSSIFLYGCAGQTEGTESGRTGPVTLNEKMQEAQNLQLAEPAAGDKVAVIETDMGTIKLKLFTEQVPEMTKNFEELAKKGKFENVPFHRVIKDFMVQTGDFTDKDGTGGYSYKGAGTELPDEIVPSLKHLYGTVSMANHGKNTNGSQFFIVTNKNGTPKLDGGYTIFGQVYEGMDVTGKIADLYIPSSGDRGTPGKIVNMTKVTVIPYTK